MLVDCHPLCSTLTWCRHTLLQRQYMIARTSLLGSIIVNMLLVLGLSILTGEAQQRGQIYDVYATRIAAGLFCLTTVSMLMPVSDIPAASGSRFYPTIAAVHHRDRYGGSTPAAPDISTEPRNMHGPYLDLCIVSVDSIEIQQSPV